MKVISWDKQVFSTAVLVSLFPMPKTKKKSKKQLEEEALILIIATGDSWGYFFYLFLRWVYLKMGPTPFLIAILLMEASMNHD